jgi:ubiquinone/menaquinone biosynthesis C-methylase UbiE
MGPILYHFAMDAWFLSHYSEAADLVASSLRRLSRAGGRPFHEQRVLDVGCGDGIMALGVCHAGAGSVTGVDVTDSFRTLPAQVSKSLGGKQLPDRLTFVQIALGQPLPFPDSAFDAAYSWSVFEHVADVSGLLAEVFRVLCPGGGFFLQIEPLFHSPYGAHLRRLADEPWGHLIEEGAFLSRARDAADRIADNEKDVLYQDNSFEDVKRYLLNEYASLNRITLAALTRAVEAAGFEIIDRWTSQVEGFAPPITLLDNYAEEDLRTNEVRFELRKPVAGGGVR